MRRTRSRVSAGVTFCVTYAVEYVYSLVLFKTAGSTSVPVVVCVGGVGAGPLMVSYASRLSAGITGRVTCVGVGVSKYVRLGAADGTYVPVVGAVLSPERAVRMLNLSLVVTYVTVFVAVVIVRVVCSSLRYSAVCTLIPVLRLVGCVVIAVAVRNRSGLAARVTVGVTSVIVIVSCFSCVSAVVTVGVTSVVPRMARRCAYCRADDTYVPVSVCVGLPSRTVGVSYLSRVSASVTRCVTVVGVLMRCLTRYLVTSRISTLVPVVRGVVGVRRRVVVADAHVISAGITFAAAVAVVMDRFVSLHTADATGLPVSAGVALVRRVVGVRNRSRCAADVTRCITAVVVGVRNRSCLSACVALRITVVGVIVRAVARCLTARRALIPVSYRILGVNGAEAMAGRSRSAASARVTGRITRVTVNVRVLVLLCTADRTSVPVSIGVVAVGRCVAM